MLVSNEAGRNTEHTHGDDSTVTPMASAVYRSNYSSPSFLLFMDLPI